MYRVTVACEGVPTHAGSAAAQLIEREFAERRRRHRRVACVFADGELVLTAENDFDAEGLVLVDEFCDSISSHMTEPFHGRVRIVSITPL